MSPSRPQPSRTSSRASEYVDADQERPGLQAGRSSSNIAAMASAQSLREASRPNSRPTSRASSKAPGANVIRKKTRPESSTIPESDAPPTSAPPASQAAPKAPTTSSGLSSTPSTSSDKSSLERRTTEAAAASPNGSTSSLSQSRYATPAGLALANQLGMSTPTGSGTQTPALRQPLLAAEGEYFDNTLSRQTTPRTLRDLGSDYTRYYNPFASRNNSHQDLPRFNSSTNLMGEHQNLSTADLQKRLSNPFGDQKRYSYHSDSRQNTAPGTPLQQHNSADKEKMAAVSAVPIGAAGLGASAMPRTGTPNFIRDADPEKAGFFPYMDDRLGAPDYSFPLFNDQKEEDDDLHMPQWDDDIKLKPRLRDHFMKENLASTIGMAFMLVGLFCVFVVLPIISYTGTSLIPYQYETPLSQMPKPFAPEPWATVNNDSYPLMKNMRHTLIDPDTPKSAMHQKGANGDKYNLAFSDEFNQKNRTFYPGDDPYWFGFDGWYGATVDMEWYDPDALNTGDGTLQLQLDKFSSHNLDFRSGMLNSWNQLCFKGGIFEVSMSLPGPGGVHGLWPGAWTMGNLGRPGYLASTDGLWPYTYNECDVGITPNQSMTDGTSFLPGQRLASCTCDGEDHPSPGTGRGAPEIDIAEVSGDWAGLGIGVATQSYQVAPFDIFWYPDYEFMENPDYSTSLVNTYTGGPFQQAVSTTSNLNNDWYDGEEYQKYSFELVPGTDSKAGITWKIADDIMMAFDARAIGPNGNIGQRIISEEPLSMIINLGFSHNWVNIDWDNLRFPTVMRVDYVRWYQKEGEEMVTCDPPGYETTQYIADHPEAYNNPNVTHWKEAGYEWPKNSLMDGCKASS